MDAIKRLAAISLTALFAMVATALPAAASEPTTWDSGEPLGLLKYLEILVGWPVLLFVVITVFALFTARNNYEPPSSE